MEKQNIGPTRGQNTDFKVAHLLGGSATNKGEKNGQKKFFLGEKKKRVIFQLSSARKRTFCRAANSGPHPTAENFSVNLRDAKEFKYIC